MVLNEMTKLQTDSKICSCRKLLCTTPSVNSPSDVEGNFIWFECLVSGQFPKLTKLSVFLNYLSLESSSIKNYTDIHAVGLIEVYPFEVFMSTSGQIRLTASSVSETMILAIAIAIAEHIPTSECCQLAKGLCYLLV
ncbi:unnamed protein product [Heterobilharzia americana]|nr:unnamed protein product [Heterobilharzia americana]